MDRQRGKLPWLLAAVVAARLLFALVIWWHNGSAGFLENDSAGYIILGQSLLRGSFSHTGPEILRTPGYPLLLSLGSALGHVLLFGILANLVFAVASAWLIWRIAIEFIGDVRAATWSVLLYCLEPVGVLYSGRILSETLYCFFFLLFLWFLLGYFQSPRPGNLLKAALTLAAATYVRPVSMYLVVWLVPVFLALRFVPSWSRRLMMATLFTAFFAAALTPWIVRNAKVAGYTGFSSTADYNLYFNSAAAILARRDREGFRQVQKELGFGDYFEVHPEQTAWAPGQIARFERNEGWRIISSHLGSYLAISIRNGAVILFDSGGTVFASLLGIYPKNGGLLSHTLDQGMVASASSFIRSYPLAAGLFLFLEFLLVVSYAVGFLGLPKLPREMRILFVAVALYFTLASAMPGAVARYRAPVMPLVCLAAGAELAARLDKRLGRELPDSAPASFVLP